MSNERTPLGPRVQDAGCWQAGRGEAQLLAAASGRAAAGEAVKGAGTVAMSGTCRGASTGRAFWPGQGACALITVFLGLLGGAEKVARTLEQRQHVMEKVPPPPAGSLQRWALESEINGS